MFKVAYVDMWNAELIEHSFAASRFSGQDLDQAFVL